ncbi:nucleotidyltransferase [Ignicoccus islandicus DSM 13165]|uniref:Nucleotidyltransferase n=1 Tax=Ignicoccus islandicus DSM 13165 TaxID=940295 RepID=A0A0U3FNS9_9CREN|nr:nucleotidyltransferase family protein [Ignicoccus islandicus]ALU11983.1 nucleotidyltransferase [Ignicoccus islandicus DSM 13165]
MKALILAGGFGKRLMPLTSERPKPMIEIAGKPILVWQIELLKRNNIKNVVVTIAHLKEVVIRELGSGHKYGVSLAYVVEDEPLGTGGAIANAKSVLEGEEKFVVMNGDIITNLNVSKLCEELKGDLVGTMALVPLPSPYGIVVFDENYKIKEFREKPRLEDYYINAGVYCFTNEIFDYLPNTGDIEKTSFPRLAREGKLKAVVFKDVYWKSIDTYKDVEEADKYLRENELFSE